MKEAAKKSKKYFPRELGMKKAIGFGVLFTILLGLCGSGFAADMELIGAGATFPYPLYSKMFDVYHKEFGIKINIRP